MDYDSMTYEDLQGELNARKQLLKNTDYQSAKAFEGVPSDSWDEIKADRERWREEIREIEEALEQKNPER